MMQRLRDAVRWGRSAQPPHRQYRPNELRADLIRAERLRHEAQRADPAPRQPGRSLDELQERRRPETPPVAPAFQPRPASIQIGSLKTRSGLRQAWLLKEILSPPLALRDPSGDDHNRWRSVASPELE